MNKLATALAGLSVAACVHAQPQPVVAVARQGSLPAMVGPAEHFTGEVRVEMPFHAAAPARVGGATVTFQPGARTAWHTHPLGQTLIVTQGVGLVQQWGGPIKEIRPGDVVSISPGVKHWHGASQTASMSHVAIAEEQDGKTVDWLEKVSDAQYRSATPPPAETPAQSTAQRLFGDVNPKLAQLTDDVLLAMSGPGPDCHRAIAAW